MTVIHSALTKSIYQSHVSGLQPSGFCITSLNIQLCERQNVGTQQFFPCGWSTHVRTLDITLNNRFEYLLETNTK